MYDTNRLGTAPRHESWDLNLSPRETFALQESFGKQLRELCSGHKVSGLWREIGDEARMRSRVGPASDNSLLDSDEREALAADPARHPCGARSPTT